MVGAVFLLSLIAMAQQSAVPYGLNWGMSVDDLKAREDMVVSNYGDDTWVIESVDGVETTVNVGFDADGLHILYRRWDCGNDLKWCRSEYRRAATRVTVSYGMATRNHLTNAVIGWVLKSENVNPHKEMPALYFHRMDTDVILVGYADLETGDLWLTEYYIEGELTDGEAIGEMFTLWQEHVAPKIQEFEDERQRQEKEGEL